MSQRGDAKPEEAVHMLSKYSAEHGSGLFVCCLKQTNNLSYYYGHDKGYS